MSETDDAESIDDIVQRQRANEALARSLEPAVKAPAFLRYDPDDPTEENPMEQMVMHKAELTKILNAGREKHLLRYRRAYAGWLLAIQHQGSELTQKAQEALARFTSDGNDEHQYKMVSLERPECFERDYDRVLGMVGHSVRDHIQLRKREYECYVLDEWPWQAAFDRQCSRYINELPKENAA